MRGERQRERAGEGGGGGRIGRVNNQHRKRHDISAPQTRIMLESKEPWKDTKKNSNFTAENNLRSV